MFYPLIALIFAALESFALWQQIRPLEFIAKPAVMLTLFFYLFDATDLTGAAVWVGVGILFSLAGDVFLLWLDRLFIFGLVAFLLGHLAYVIGFNSPASEVSAWGFVLAVMIGISGARVIRRILAALAEKGQSRLRAPVLIYGIVISIMLLSAMLKLTDASWDANAALLVAAGAFLFFMSDIVLAWNKFVTPINHGRIINIGLYHLGQIALISGVVMQIRLSLEPIL
ncbi:MAG: lysoplasmalogenase [Chloroflexota bacterium]